MNWLSIGAVGIILLVSIGLNIYYKIKLRNLDGFMGIISSEPEDEDNH